MIFIRYFDLHCDTLSECFKKNYDIRFCPFHISLDKLNFDSYFQIMAIWSDEKESDEDAYQTYRKIVDYARKSGIQFSKKSPLPIGKKFFLSVEDARILNGDISRINVLKNDGVRFIAPFWKGENVLGGAWDTDIGLSQFGKDAIEKFFSAGIITDISHSSKKSANQIFIIAENHKMPVIATHSCSFSVYNHERNLDDSQFETIKNLGGIVGINFVSEHLCRENASINDVLNHIEYFLSKNGENTIAIGSDFDGTSSLPIEINGIENIDILYEKSISRFGKKLTSKIFYKNAYEFINKNLK